MVDLAQKSRGDCIRQPEPRKLPIFLYAEKTHPVDEQDEVDLEAITWPDEMGVRTPYIDEPRTSSETLRRDQYYDRPFDWILQSITGDPDVHMKNNYPSDYVHSPSWQAELREIERQEEEHRRQNGIPSDDDL
ncbi:hypothetical protein N7481_006821 [Penicillium waksmanii]|uniref:uncharacterized protein n=1 Tax=Penicillium waksmanii TaxID=69791 RepID=UPI002546E939|nr:uncharacterized protein N7481_006821 [Penicillium waksmanii]KAJ5984722.1 hypothetical protein N7481_006821 [Penicillium waksmanii]